MTSTPSESPPWKRLLDYWRLQLGDGTPPADLNPARDLPEIADALTVIDVSAKPFRYLTFSQQVAQRLGTDLTGKQIGGSQLIEAVKLDWNRMLENVMRLGLPRRAEIEGEQNWIYHVVALPLKDANGKVERIMTGLFFAQPTPMPAKIIIKRWRELSVDSE